MVSRSAAITVQRRASASTCALFSVVCRERDAPRRNSASTKRGMTNARVAFSGSGNGRAGRSESMAAFASNASRSNRNFSPERLANSLRQVASCFLADRGPVATFGCDALVERDTHFFMVADAGQWFGELQDLLFGDVFSFDRYAHRRIRITPHGSSRKLRGQT